MIAMQLDPITQLGQVLSAMTYTRGLNAGIRSLPLAVLYLDLSTTTFFSRYAA